MDSLESHKHDYNTPAPEAHENNPNLANKPVPTEPKNAVNINSRNIRKDSSDSNSSRENPVKNTSRPHQNVVQPMLKNAVMAPVGRAPPPPPPPPPPHPHPHPHPRPPSNVSFVLQPVMPQLFPPPRVPAAPHVFPNTYYAEYAPPWHFTYEGDYRHHGNVNLNFNIPPKNLVVNSRGGTVECKNACRPEEAYGVPPQNQGCWIKPTIFYDGFWTEQKVKKWVAEQVEKQFPEDHSLKSASPGTGHPEPPKA